MISYASDPDAHIDSRKDVLTIFMEDEKNKHTEAYTPSPETAAHRAAPKDAGYQGIDRRAGRVKPQTSPAPRKETTSVDATPAVVESARPGRTVWSSDKRKVGRPPIPAGSVAAGAGQPIAPRASRNGGETPKVTGQDAMRNATGTNEKKRPPVQPAARSTGRPSRSSRRATHTAELPRMDDLLIDDTPVEPDVSPDEYVPGEAEIDRILQYELYTPQSRQIPDIIPEDKVVIVGVRFRPGGKTYFFDPGRIRCQNGQAAIVETARGQEFGEICMGNRMVDRSLVVPPLRPLIRLATAEDIAHNQQNRDREAEAYRIGAERIRAHKLDMKLVGAQYTFDDSKLLFYFTSDNRVDFRELVKDLAGVFHIRIELRQIGIRDEARMIGGLGPCGRPLCCSTFLTDFGQVSMKMAKEQNLSLNSTKISGCCGRLMCCLRYEHETYQEEYRRSPAQGSFVMTPDGPGVVTEVYPIAGEVKVSLRGQNEPTYRRFKRELVSLQAPGPRPGEGSRDTRRASGPIMGDELTDADSEGDKN